MERSKIKAVFDKDSRKYHRFNIEANDEGVVGMIYFPRDGDSIPNELIIRLVTKTQAEK